jgi:hypothetical protein
MMSEKVKAMEMALDAIERKRTGAPAPMACCTRCGEPLIGTFRFAGYEFVCICCGKLLGFVEPTPKAATPELDARQAELQRLWNEAVKSDVSLAEWIMERKAGAN